MKKVMLLLTAFLLVAQASYAYYEEYTSSDIASLQEKGYSQELLKIVDTARYLKQGAEKDYVPFYSRKFYSDNPILKYYQMARRYWDPASDSSDFGFKEINFQNGWFDASPSYSRFVNPNDRFQRLFDDDIKRLEYTGRIVKGSNGSEDSAREILNVSEEDAPKTETRVQRALEDEFILEDL